MLEVEGSATDLTNQTVIINFVLQEWDIDGTIKITKNDKIKRFFDFVGREKGGKPKKQKSDKQRLIEVKKDGEGTKTETLTPPPPPNK
jgi:glycine cleavage system aminomethyltransferase T